jgi:hypothetical protein
MILIKPDTGEIYKEFLSRYTTTTGLSNVKQLAEKTLSYRKNLLIILFLPSDWRITLFAFRSNNEA